MTIKKSELLEFSFVTVPANPHALTLMTEAKMNVEELVQKGIVKVKITLASKVVKTEVQTLILSKKVFKTKEEAVKWVKDHDFKAGKIDETDETFRFRQFMPDKCKGGSFRTIRITRGVKAVICRLKKKSASCATKNKQEEDELLKQVGAIVGNFNTRVNDEIVKMSKDVMDVVKSRTKHIKKKAKAGETGQSNKDTSPSSSGEETAPKKTKVGGRDISDGGGEGKGDKDSRELSPSEIDYLMFKVERSVLKTINNLTSEALSAAKKKAQEHFAKQK